MLDVDGTLAPIAPTPDGAAIPRATLDILRRLVALPGVTLAFVSGRAAEDTWRMTGVAGAFIAGNHGAELRTPAGVTEVVPEMLHHESAVANAARLLARDTAHIRGVLLENKTWTLSVHYRLVDAADVPGLRRRATEVAGELGLRILEGKKIVELRPAVDINKGTAARTLLARAGVSSASGSALYVGDDRTDEDAFRVLRDAMPGAVTVRVEHDDASLDSAAEITLRGTEQVSALLEWMLSRRTAGTRAIL